MLPQRIHSFDATLSEGGLLTISRCPAHARRTYTPLPNTRLWSIEQKTHERAAYQSNVLKALMVGPAPGRNFPCLCGLGCQGARRFSVVSLLLDFSRAAS